MSVKAIETQKEPSSLALIPRQKVRAVEGHPGYAVASDGSVWTCRRACRGKTFHRNWRQRIPDIDRYGYLVIALGSRKTKLSERVHVLVLQTFVGPRPPGSVGCHNDGNRLNCNLENLRWDTRSSNEIDKIIHGTSPTSKLTADQVISIRERHARGGVTPVQLAGEHRVSSATIVAIIRRKSWKHI